MLKRAFDLIVSLILLVALSPLLLGLALAVRLSSSGPVFHRAVRIGKEGKPFTLLKFRSMVVGAPRQGPHITRGGDPRVTPAGAFLRKYKLDELPQLVNVLRGDMSLVGPRPEDPRYVALYDAEQRRVLDIRPGITSLASIRYRDEEAILALADDLEETYTRVVMPTKLAIDLEYIEHASLWLDLLILVRTADAVCRPGRIPREKPVLAR